MKIKKIAIKSNSLLEQTLLPLLIGRVFHVTNKKSFEKIKKSNLINPNAQNKYTYNFPQSAQNFGSRNNMVCLIDLRQKDFNTSLNLSGGGYYFLHPKNEWTEVIFLFLESNFYK
ncbi:MAG: hypothetical protein HYT27_01255, partial [Parcubacteria group bacterium]|nr:hypothetical protein [Parcubacteria group bacterium]